MQNETLYLVIKTSFGNLNSKDREKRENPDKLLCLHSNNETNKHKHSPSRCLNSLQVVSHGVDGVGEERWPSNSLFITVDGNRDGLGKGLKQTDRKNQI